MRKIALAACVALTGLAILAGNSSGSTPPITQATGCQRVPASGSVLPGAAAATTLEYSNRWQWSNASASLSFDWSIRKSDGTSVASGSSGGLGDTRTVTANNYLFRVVNRSSVGQFWNVCYDVV
jgi:hypothetical protein